MEEKNIEDIAFTIHKFFRLVDGKNDEENKAIHDLWKAIGAVPDRLWKQAFEETLHPYVKKYNNLKQTLDIETGPNRSS